MTETIISLLSILAGIIASNIFGFYYKKSSFDVIGNSIIGVFGSIFFIKSFARLGFDPISIMKSGKPDLILLFINFFVSVLGSVIFYLFVIKLKNKLQN